MRLFDCRFCGKTNLLAPKRGRLPKFCVDCRRLHDIDRMLARCEVDKARRRELRNPNCRDCDQPLTFNDSGNKMDMRFVCDACQLKTKQATDAQYRLKIGHTPTGTLADIVREARERREAKKAARAEERGRQLAAKLKDKPWLNPKLTDAQQYRLRYKLDADFRVREVARSVKRHKETPLLRTWENIIARCENANTSHYHRYGGRGIKCLEPFRSSFQAFADHVNQELGPRPSLRHSVDRIDPDGHYAVGNLRWGDDFIQANNRSQVRTTPAMLAATMRARRQRRQQQTIRRANAERAIKIALAS